jgi:hypothetical protein
MVTSVRVVEEEGNLAERDRIKREKTSRSVICAERNSRDLCLRQSSGTVIYFFNQRIL